jgi:hypothetical protein
MPGAWRKWQTSRTFRHSGVPLGAETDATGPCTQAEKWIPGSFFTGLLQISYCFKSEEASGMTCIKGSGRIESCPVKGRS